LGYVPTLLIESSVIISTIVVFLLANTDSGLLACQADQSDTARLACYDKAMDRATSEITPVPESPATQDTTVEEFRIEQKAVSDIDPEELFGVSANEAKKDIEKATGVETIDAIEDRVAEVDRDPYGKLVFILENKQRWRQLDSNRLNLAPGEEVRIRSAAMNSFLMEKLTGSRSIRVRRVD
jgi:hypothetical protein